MKRSFNSIKVRLELQNMEKFDTLQARFQFHKGTIRTMKTKYCILPIRCFNSIKVRLERLPGRAVRTWCAFQFHKGTIRTGE